MLVSYIPLANNPGRGTAYAGRAARVFDRPQRFRLHYSIGAQHHWNNMFGDWVRTGLACIELCLDAGALPDGPEMGREERRAGNTPLWPAVEQGRPEFVRLLLSAGADPNAMWNLSVEPRYCTTLVVLGGTVQRTKLFNCYWLPAPITRPRTTRGRSRVLLLFHTRSATGITACGPYSSKPVLLFRTPGGERRLSTRNKGGTWWRSATSIWPRSRRPAA